MWRKGLLVMLMMALWSFEGLGAPSDPLQKGDTIPSLALKNLKGEIHRLHKPDNQLTLVYFWASWCKPCQQTLPEYMELYRKYKNASFEGGIDGFSIYAISVDKTKRAWEQAASRHRIPERLTVSDLRGWESIAVRRFQVGAIPASFLVDGQGVIKAVEVKDQLRAYLKNHKR